MLEFLLSVWGQEQIPLGVFNWDYLVDPLGIEPRTAVYKTAALPLGYGSNAWAPRYRHYTGAAYFI